MNTLYLQPTDVLFFRDGRPMSGSLSGHGAAWPLPTVTNAALHAALWRAGDTFEAVHKHRRGRSGCYDSDVQHRDRKFGSLVTAGPYPVTETGDWLFARPLDAGLDAAGHNSAAPALFPLDDAFQRDLSSLPSPLRYPVANSLPPTKKTPAPWWNSAAWQQYLGMPASSASDAAFFKDEAFADTEFNYGIGMDAETQTQDGERFYSAHYLRLREHCKIGLLAEALDKLSGSSTDKRDLIPDLFQAENHIVVGGQQRLCSVCRETPAELPLPKGMSSGFATQADDAQDRWLVKWVLLSPAVFPEIPAGTSKRGTERQAHPGGWLPTWICPESGKVLLQAVEEAERKRRRSLNAAGKGYQSVPDIPATLVAALVGKPVTVTGYAIPHETIGEKGGAKPTHLAVPAGSVYYFECPGPDQAAALAAALNWHGRDSFETIKNRRSTLFGEKGFGLGVCGTWSFHRPNP